MKKIFRVALATILFYSTSILAQTAGTMSFSYTTINPGSGWYNNNNANKYVLAVWIESCATCGAGTTAGTSTFVRTKLRYCSLNSTEDHLPTYGVKAGATAADCITGGNVVNAITGATQTTFGLRTITWDGTNAAGTTLLPDGNYRVCIQQTWGHGSSTVTRYFPFVKGPSLYTNTTDVATDNRFSGISLTWTPSLSNESFSKGPEVIVYPNPSQGIFKLDLKSQVNSITVANSLGAIVYKESIDETNTETTKTIDLTSFSNGVYFINVADDKGSSSYKVVLDK
jgi:hypothetical protein